MLAKILHFSLTQRFVIVLSAIFLIVTGIVSWQNLTLDALPDITPNQVTINTPTPGMGPAEIERQVTFPIETAMGGIPGVQEVRSLSYYGLSQVVVTFSDDTDIYFARQLVNERLGTVHDQLPAGLPSPQLGPVSTGLGEIYFYAVESETRNPMELRTLQDWVIRPHMRTVPGVAEVNSIGGREKQFNVEIDPKKMQARNVSLRQVLDAIQKNNANVGGGYIERNGEQTTIRSIGMATSLADIAHMVVGAEHGTPILISDIANVNLDSPLRTGVSTKDGKEAVVGTVLMLKGANGRAVSRAAEARMKVIREQLPPDVKVTTLYNRSELVDQTVHTVARSLVEGGILVIIVLLVLLGNLRGAVIAAVAIPLSMLIAVIAMNRFGVSGNLMSLGAIDFGLIVDGAIIMVENCVRRLAEQRAHLGRRLTEAERRHTVEDACGEVRKVTQFGELIIIATYLPILALEGIEGKMFRPMALAVVFALLGALVLSLTLIPTLCSLFLSRDTQEKRNLVMEFCSRLYRPILNLALRRRALVLISALCLLAFAGLLFPRLGAEFIPQLDEGSIDAHPVRLRTVGAGESVKLLIAMEKAIKEIPEVVTVISRAGTSEVANDPMPISFGDTFIMLKPRDQWRTGMTTKAKLLDDIQDKLKDVPGQGYGFTQPIQDRFDELASGVKADIGIKVFGEDLTILKQKADAIAARIRKVPGAQDVSVEQVDNIPVLEIQIDREAIARVGVNVSDIQEWVETTLGGRAVGQVVEGDRRFDLTVRLPEPVRADVETLQALPIATPNGSSVPLASLVMMKTIPAPAQISRDSGKRRVVVQCNVRGRDLGSFVAEAQAAVKRDVKFDAGYYVEWGGQFENLQRANARLVVVVPLALVLIFALLFTTFGSVKQAALIYTGIPLAITGGVIALWLRELPFSISAGVGFIALSGVAVLNGVVMVSAINRLREQGRTIVEAVRLGALQRLRPVLMTALVAALGFIPMALNTGIGAEVQRPLATVVIGGILSSTLLTLVVLPTLYIWFERDDAKEKK